MQIRTLGGLELVGAAFERPKPLLLLAYLAIEGARERRFLQELFWPTAKRPAASLSQALWQLERDVPGALVREGGRLRGTLAADAQQFLDEVEAGRHQQALDLYRGPFLEGVALDWGVELEEWVYGTREYLAGRCREALLRLAEAAGAAGAFVDAAGRAEEAYFLRGAPEPEPEEFERLFTLLQAGGHPRAGEVRKEAASFGIGLQLSTEVARERLGAAASEALRPIPHNLVRPLTSFVGRDAEIIELAGLLGRPDGCLVTITGLGGIGKSRLALQVAWDQLRQRVFDQGVYFVALDTIASPTSLGLALAQALGVGLSSQEGSLERVMRWIGDRRMLVVLDNFEHLLEGAVLVSGLLSACPGLTLLVTSRERLNLVEERVFTLGGLSLPAVEAPQERPELEEAVQLFVQRARSVNLRFEVTPETLPAVLRICRLVEGSPLGIELAAAWVKLLAPVEIAAEMERTLDFLTSPARNIPERHQSIRATFEYSWQSLSEEERSILRRLAVFRGGFRRGAAAEVVGATIPVLASLLDKSLLRVSSEGRYDRHPLLYQFTREKLAEQPDDQRQAEETHGRFFLDFLRSSSRLPETRGVLGAIDEDLENIRAAVRWAAASGRPNELRISAGHLLVFLDKRGYAREGAAFFAELGSLLDRADRLQRPVLGYLLIARAWFEAWLSNYPKALPLLRRGLALLRAAGDPEGCRMGVSTLGHLSWRSGDYRGARAYFEQALSLSGKSDDRVTALGNLGLVECFLGNYGQAEGHLADALALRSDLGERDYLVSVLNAQGLLELSRNRPQLARGWFLEGLGLARKLGSEQLVPFLLTGCGFAFSLQGEHREARDLCREAVREAWRVGVPSAQSFAMATEARAALALGAVGEARELALRGLEISWAAGEMVFVAVALLRLGEVLMAEGDVRARSVLQLLSWHAITPRWVRDEACRLLSGEGSSGSEGEIARPEATPLLEELVTSFFGAGRDELATAAERDAAG